MKIAKRIMAVFLLVLLCLPVGMTAEAASVNETAVSSGQTDGSQQSRSKSANGVINTEDFEIRVSYGLNGNFRTGVAIPVTIYIKSLKKDFEGTVRMIVPGDSEYGTSPVAYEKDILLSTGVQKVVTMSVYSCSVMSTFKFQLEDASGEVFIDKSVTMKSQLGDNALIGVLSDDYTALNYFDGLSISLPSGIVQTVRLVELGEVILPEQASGLDSLSYLIINSYDTSKLSQEQYDAIRKWTAQGGVLIIGTGSDYSRTLSGFRDDFVEGTIGEAAEGTLELDVEKSEALKYTKEQGIVSLSLKDGKPLTGIFKQEDENTGLIWNRDYKQGHVVVTAFNLGMEPIVSWNQTLKLASLLLEESASGYSGVRMESLSYGGGSGNQWMMSNALDGLHDIKYPDMKLMGILFLLFVILIGPGLYLILKLVDKREWMWILVPVLAVGFTVGIFTVTQNLRIKHPREASLTTLYYDMDFETGVQENVDMAVQVPGAGEEKVNLDPTLGNLKLYGGDYNDYYTNTGVLDQKKLYEYKTAVRETSEGYMLGIRNRETFGSTYMSMNHVTEDSKSCGLDVEITRNTTGVSGRVTNRTERDLQHVMVFAGKSMVMIGDLKSGDSVEFTEKDGRYFNCDIYSITFPGMSEDSAELQQQRSILELFCERYLYSMDAMDVYAYAYMGEIDADYVKDEQVEEQNRGIIVRHDRIGYSDYENAEILTLYDYSRNFVDGWDSDGQLYVEEIEVEFDISGLVEDIYALIRARDSEAQYGPTDSVTVYGYNVESGQYDELFADDIIMKFENGCPYLNDKGIVRLKFTCPRADDYIYTPQITVVGGES